MQKIQYWNYGEHDYKVEFTKTLAKITKDKVQKRIPIALYRKCQNGQHVAELYDSVE